MDLKITKEEKAERIKGKVTTIFSIPILIVGLSMLVCRIIFIFTQNPELKFSIGTEIIPILVLGYTLFSAKDTVLKGMIGLLLPSKK